MKKTARYLSIAMILISVFLMAAGNTTAFGQKSTEKIKIGTYDSRLVIYAWSKTDALKKYLQQFAARNDSAEKAHDTVKIRENAIRGISFQHLLHQSVFSNGSVNFIMGDVKDKLPELAKSKGVIAIVSKWELPWCDQAVEITDLTNEVAALFQPKENIEKIAEEIRKQVPIKLDELGIESEMLDQYCQRYSKK